MIYDEKTARKLLVREGLRVFWQLWTIAATLYGTARIFMDLWEAWK